MAPPPAGYQRAILLYGDDVGAEQFGEVFDALFSILFGLFYEQFITFAAALCFLFNYSRPNPSKLAYILQEGPYSTAAIGAMPNSATRGSCVVMWWETNLTIELTIAR